MTTPAASYTTEAHTALVAAARAEPDFAELAATLSAVAAELGSTDALTAGRPGSWEAELVRQLVNGTGGSNDEYLLHYARPKGSR
jgi:hypothetical protein